MQTVSNGQIKLQDGMECMCEIYLFIYFQSMINSKKMCAGKKSILFTRASKVKN